MINNIVLYGFRLGRNNNNNMADASGIRQARDPTAMPVRLSNTRRKKKWGKKKRRKPARHDSSSDRHCLNSFQLLFRRFVFDVYNKRDVYTARDIPSRTRVTSTGFRILYERHRRFCTDFVFF